MDGQAKPPAPPIQVSFHLKDSHPKCTNSSRLRSSRFWLSENRRAAQTNEDLVTQTIRKPNCHIPPPRTFTTVKKIDKSFPFEAVATNPLSSGSSPFLPRPLSWRQKGVLCEIPEPIVRQENSPSRRPGPRCAFLRTLCTRMHKGSSFFRVF